MAGALGDNSLDLPFEPVPDGPVETDVEGYIAGGVVVLAGMVDVPGIGNTPCLVFKFANPDGSGFYPPVTLVADEDGMTQCAHLVSRSVAASIRAVREAS